MKRKNLFLSLLLAGACAIVGVGYAAITRELKIGGQLAGQKNDNSLKVEFQSNEGEYFATTTPVNSSTAIVVTPTITNDHAANLDVSGMVDIGDIATAYFLVKNESQATTNLDATLTLPNVIVNNGSTTATDNNDETNVFEGAHFQITAEYVTDTGDSDKATGTATINADKTVELAAPTADAEGETVWVKVTVELIDVIVADTFPTHNITISFTASTK